MAGFDINFGALQPLNPLAAVDYYDYGQKQQRKKREDQPPASLGLSYFREER